MINRRVILVGATLATFFAMASGELDEAQLIGTTDKARAIDYEPGETMTFTLTLKNAKPFTAGAYEIRWTRTGDDGQKTEALRYFDPVNMAKRVSRKCKFTVTRAGLGDYVCPPSGIAVMYNNLPCDKTINWVQGSTHGHVPPEGLGNQQFTLHEGNAE